WFTPCNEVLFFDPSIIEIDPDATAEDEQGNEEPLTQAHIDQILSKTIPLPDGRLRASASLFLEGRPIGPWRYEETRDDDPNDVFDHQDRRDVRGMYVLAAWLNHFDTREQNTLAMYIEVEPADAPAEDSADSGQPKGYVRHNMIDFGDCFGS